MKRINQRQAIEAIRNKEAFRAGSLSGGHVYDSEAYVVKSYNKIIASILFGIWYFEECRSLVPNYNKITLKHQSIVRQAIGEV